MFNIGPAELVVLAIVAVIVLGPDRLPGLAKDAARLIRSLRDMATGAREQLRDELGPEFADLDLRSLNPRTAIQRVILGDDEDGSSFRADLRKLDPRGDLRDQFRDADPRAGLRESFSGVDPRGYVKDAMTDDAPISMTKPVSDVVQPQQRPLGRGEAAPYDADAT